MEHAKKFLRTFLGLPITIITFLFIGKIFFDNREILAQSFSELNSSLFALGLLFFALFFLVKGFVWIIILKKRGFELPIRQTIFDYSFSEIKRYIPGSIFAFATRMNSHSHLVPKKETLKGIGIEAILLTLSAVFVSIPALLFLVQKTNTIPTSLMPLIVLAILAGTGVILFLYPKIRQHVQLHFEGFLLFIAAWIFYALGCFFVTVSFTGFNPQAFQVILSLFVLSWLSGYLLFIAPMGLGVREVVTIFCLSFFMPPPIAAVIALLTRVGMIFGELLFVAALYSVARIKSSSKLLQLNPYLVIVTLVATVYFIFFSYYSMQKHSQYLTGRFDLGNMSQTVWNTSQGRFFTLTNPDGTENLSRMAVHSDILLVLFTPFYFIWSDPQVLLIFQSMSLAIGGVTVFLIARYLLKNEKIATVLSISFFCNFWIHEQNLFDFHAVSIATTLLLITFYFMIRKRYVLFLVFLALACMTKENVFLVASFFGVYLFFIEKRREMGTILGIGGILTFIVLSVIIIPNARGTEHFALHSFYSYLGSSPSEILTSIFTRPHLVIQNVLSPSSLAYIHHLFIPTGYLAILSPLYLIFAIPDFAIYMLSDHPGLRSYQYHYGSIIIPFIYISTIYSIRMIQNKWKYPQKNSILFYYILLAGVGCMFYYSPFPGTRAADYSLFRFEKSSTIDKYLSIIPGDASVAASNNVGAHLSHREHIYVIPHMIDGADYVVLFREKEGTESSINMLNYDVIIEDKELSFYLFKKKFSIACNSCQP